MKNRIHPLVPALVLMTALLLSGPTGRAADNQLLGWNNLGMHCMDSDYSVFSILPPYNTIEAQLIVNGLLVTNGNGYSVTYQAVADPAGSLNSTSRGKGDFYDFTAQLYALMPVDMGLAGWAMPGTNNLPQSMLFEPTNFPAPGATPLVNWWRAEGIPLTPYDNALNKNPYPMMLLVARDAGNNVIATNQIVLPVSDEMDCSACHASSSYTNAQPSVGWVNVTNLQRDYRLNILLLHDERQFALNPDLYSESLTNFGFDTNGLFTTVILNNQPVLCASCHASVALGTSGYKTIPQLTEAIHSHHASVPDPVSGVTLNDSANRAACYRCHPGSTTKCLRGAMGAAVAADGSMAMQCQSCHGTMSQVGAANRIGWLMEPKCQSCHTGTAANNNGQIRYTSAFDLTGQPRVAVDQTFATQPDTPATGLSLYRFSAGHGGLQCEACHGSTHAEFPSTHLNDNLRNIQLQGHVGMMVECMACHTNMPSTINGGPHGLHPLGQDFVNRHSGLFDGGATSITQCQPCHGTDYRGTVLSQAQDTRSLSASFDGGSHIISLYRGAIVGCYLCHNGPYDDNPNTRSAPAVRNVTLKTAINQPVSTNLPTTGSALTVRIISQPTHGSVGLVNQTATYFPDPGFMGADSFTYAAFDGAKNSNLGTGTINVGKDNIPPTIQITTPTTKAIYTTTNAVISLTGIASDNVAITKVTWANNRGGSGVAIGTTSWSANNILLKGGVNVITVRAHDAANHVITGKLTVNYASPKVLVVLINGSGTVTPNLNGKALIIGRTYKLTAVPTTGHAFNGWTGAITAASPIFTFVFNGGMILQANFTP
jgi:hypothetical protein